jgi:hypothetical protein
MATRAQIRANRRNAQRSTGPRSEAGKENCKMNALKHGLASRDFVLGPEEKAEEYEALQAQLRLDHQPATQIEEILVEEIAQSWWRLQRARLHEAEILRQTTLVTNDVYARWFGPIMRYQAAAERALHRAITQLRTTQNDRRRHEPAEPQAAESLQPEQTEQVMAIGSVAQNTPVESSDDHSCRSAQTGSTAAARIAGMKLAPNVTSASNTGTEANVSGSSGLTS